MKQQIPCIMSRYCGDSVVLGIDSLFPTLWDFGPYRYLHWDHLALISQKNDQILPTLDLRQCSESVCRCKYTEIRTHFLRVNELFLFWSDDFKTEVVHKDSSRKLHRKQAVYVSPDQGTSGNGQAWSSPSPRGQWRTEKNGRNWLWNHLWCPNSPRG